MKKSRKIIFSSIISLIIFLIIFMFLYDTKLHNIKTNELISVKLDKCIDGDTAWFKTEKNSKKYRFLAIDSPELDTEKGANSAYYVCEILKEAKKIEIEYDIVGYSIDKYGRELVWVYVDGELLQEKLLEKGYAKIKYIYANYEYLDKLFEIENEAINNRLGIWENYTNKVYNDYYTVTFDYSYSNKSVKVLKNSMVDLIDNPYIEGCRFIGWKYGNYLFDLSTKINKDYNLSAKFDC